MGRIITYVLLCGYSPFRSDDVKQLVKETTEAKITFHERYWKNVSEEGQSPSPSPFPHSRLSFVDDVVVGGA